MPHDNSDWLKEVYYDIIQNYIINCIPTIKGFSANASDIKIRHIDTNIPLSIVNDNLQWFKWNDNKNVNELISSAERVTYLVPSFSVDITFAIFIFS